MKHRGWVAVLFLMFGAAVVPTHASVPFHPSDFIQAAHERNLAGHPVWLKLLHYHRRGERSEVISPEFFLSVNGAVDPRAELEMLISAYFGPWTGDTNEHPRCRFPARYFWLAQQLPLPNYQLRDSRCQRLERWALFDRVRSISVLLISGYFGNPASTFGHALIKLNTDTPEDQPGLFDLSLNFGALVPEDEPTLLYVTRGLLGGYEAGFSDKYFYTQDLVYARTELRDIWDYRLGLSDDARTLLVLHVWEIIGKKYRYYFLTKNCAYRLAGLLELATGEVFLDNTRMWYLPVELFHRLIDVDATRKAAEAPPLIQSVRFVPSSQRTLHREFAGLTSREADAANEIVDGRLSTGQALAGIEPERQAAVLDAALSYFQFRLIGEQPSPSLALRHAKDRVLLDRLRLPVRSQPPDPPPSLISPADAPRPMRLGLGIGQDRDGHGQLLVHASPFIQEITDRRDLMSDELAVFDLTVGRADQRSFLSRIDVVRVRKFNTLKTPIADESNLSWQFRLGAQRVYDRRATHTDGLISYGLGRAWRWNDNAGAYAIADLAAHTVAPNARVLPHFGIFHATGPWGTTFKFGVENADDANGWRGVWGGRLQFQYSKDQILRLDIGNETTTRLALSAIWHW